MTSEARRAERKSGLARAEIAIHLAGRIAPGSLPQDSHRAAKRFVKLIFHVKKDVPAA